MSLRKGRAVYSVPHVCPTTGESDRPPTTYVPHAQVASSGKEFDRTNAPGYAEVAEKKAAQKKASLEAYNARVAELAANRDSGVAPPKPWER